MTIPKVLHHIWLDAEEMPEETAELVENVRATHPGWTFHLWTHDNLPGETVRDEWRNPLRSADERSDLLRLEVVHRIGGFYLDTEFEALAPIDSLLADVSMVVASHADGRASSDFFGAEAGHPIVRALIEEAVPVDVYGVNDEASGPVFFDRAIGARTGASGLQILPPELVCFAPTEPSAATVLRHVGSGVRSDDIREEALRATGAMESSRRRLADLERLLAETPHRGDELAAARERIAELNPQLKPAVEARDKAIAKADAAAAELEALTREIEVLRGRLKTDKN